ncbi:MAG: hypothetical protein MZV64_32590 [Ignavibacteriales bacterium]|nr:hypothetical protein [Ignavibacteriales bacterium]
MAMHTVWNSLSLGIAVFSLKQFVFINRMFGPYAWAYWIMVSCNVIFPQFFWFKKIRRSIPAMMVIVLFVNVGMWFERFVIVVTSLAS